MPGAPWKAGTLTRRNTIRTQLPVSVSSNRLVSSVTDATFPDGSKIT